MNDQLEPEINAPEEPKLSLCVEQIHFAVTTHVLFTQYVNEVFCTFYACARCGVVFSPDAVIREVR